VSDAERREMKPIVPRLWFDTDGEEAAQLYTSIVPNSRITEVLRHGSAGPVRKAPS
jgi:predicted 3-demethylubiquinone-9 3-methyltransferase (glyoxalase superfamily)